MLWGKFCSACLEPNAHLPERIEQREIEEIACVSLTLFK